MFVISSRGGAAPCDYAFYNGHGEFRGVENVISYSNLAGAKKFFTRDAAQTFINTELPVINKSSHTVIKFGAFALLMFSPEDYHNLLIREQAEKSGTNSEREVDVYGEL